MLFAIGAATRIRTGDLILTKDVLYQLSHSSIRPATIVLYQMLFSLSRYLKKYFSKALFLGRAVFLRIVNAFLLG